MWRQWKAFKCRKLAARCVISPWSYRSSVRIQELHEFVLVLQRCQFHFLWQSKRLPLILNHKDIENLGRYTQVQGTPGETIWLELLLLVPSQISHCTTVPTHICAGQFFSQQERVALLFAMTQSCTNTILREFCTHLLSAPWGAGEFRKIFLVVFQKPHPLSY